MRSDYIDETRDLPSSMLSPPLETNYSQAVIGCFLGCHVTATADLFVLYRGCV